jgi:hypothetical protein
MKWDGAYISHRNAHSDSCAEIFEATLPRELSATGAIFGYLQVGSTHRCCVAPIRLAEDDFLAKTGATALSSPLVAPTAAVGEPLTQVSAMLPRLTTELELVRTRQNRGETTCESTMRSTIVPARR